jgi:Lon-like ATP-dependent protease
MNPVIVIDEIDKLMMSNHHGNPAAALLEVLDPEQNSAFQDTYLEVPVDLSKVMFICTANDASVIPPPLLNRMEMIYVPGYVTAEKVAIAEGYLSPKALKNSGLEGAHIGFTRGALQDLAQNYTEESGVRDLNKAIEKVYRKIARELVEDLDAAPESSSNMRDLVKEKSLTVDSNDLYRYLGPSNSRDLHFDELSIGVARGCAFTSAGGASLYVESVLQEVLSPKSTGKSIRTGMIRQVMDESLSVAYSFARMFVANNYPRNRFFKHAVIHTHYPVGAIPKDGPSAGIVSATSLLSLALKQRVRSDVCMTGELTLTGRVLKIGGVREKAAAAKNDGVKHFILPEANMADWHELPDVVKEGLNPIPVKTYDDVFAAAFGVVDPNEANTAWDQQLRAPEADEHIAARPPTFVESAV